MADENRRVITEYVAKLNKTSYNQVSQELKRQSSAQVTDANKSLNVNEDIRKSLISQAKEARTRNREAEKVISTEKTRLELLEKQSREIRGQVGSIGDVDSALSAIRGGSSALTGTNIPGLEQAAAVFEVTEAMAQLKGAAPAAKEAIMGLADSMGAKGIGLAAVAVVAVGAIVAVGQALSKQFDQELRQQAARLEAGGKFIEQINTGLTSDELFNSRAEVLRQLEIQGQKLTAAETEFASFSEDFGKNLEGVIKGTKGQAEEAYNTELTAYENLVAELDRYNQALASNETANNDASKISLQRVADLRAQFTLEQQVNAFAQSATEETLNARLATIQAERDLIISQQAELQPLLGKNTELGQQARDIYAGLADQMDMLNQESALLNGTIKETVILRDAENAALERQKEAQAEQERIAKQREASLTRLVSLEQASIKAIDDFASKQSEIIADRTLRDQRELEDYNIKSQQSQAKHQENLTKIQADGNERIADVNSKLGDNRADFFASEIKETQNYRKELGKLNQQYRREDKNALDDHLASLRNAEQGNDVIAFLAEKQRFAQEQREKEQQRSQEFSDLNTRFNEERQLRQQAFQERQADLQREIVVVRQQTEQKIAESQRAFAQEQQLADQERQRSLARQQQDDQISDQRSRVALQRTLAEINLKAQAELNAIREVTRAVGELEAVARRIASNAGSSSSNNMSRSNAIGTKSYEQNKIRVINSAGGGATGFAFNTGGVVRGGKPQIGMVGDTPRDIDEAIIPFKRSKGLASALQDYGIFPPRGNGAGGSGAVVTLNFAPNLTIGDIASSADVTQALQDFAGDLETQLTGAFNRAVNQAG